ncbi:MgtC/SapB family protein [Mucilaginibacter achroorhodeus]|uniref:MgtC/SapB family protein n=1 Tax=Mucilaginibacter achroorhodeus TaxID=2599294 RepID=A0A563UBD5_9SPHI|nr:MgtC/SapB family protein [Mucilaginibacter achroorhodeus]TWR28677.1 MgtC/SapB family protein [Mucilaginibacter achroorhodeus]
MIALTDILIRLAVAAVLGSLIGLERQRHDWVAGLRTHMLVCVGAALAMIVSMDGFNDVVNKPGVGLDPSRVAAQVVSGIGFLGAGTIFFLKSEIVKGLTTAAGLWTVAVVGLAVGGGLYIPAAATTAIVLIILAAIKPVERRLFDKNKYTAISVQVGKDRLDIHSIQQVLENHLIGIKEVRLTSPDELTDQIKIAVRKSSSKSPESLAVLQELQKLPGVNMVEFVSH